MHMLAEPQIPSIGVIEELLIMVDIVVGPCLSIMTSHSCVFFKVWARVLFAMDSLPSSMRTMLSPAEMSREILAVKSSKKAIRGHLSSPCASRNVCCWAYTVNGPPLGKVGL